MELNDLDFNDIERLMDDFKKSEIRELEITTDGFHIHLSKNETPFLPVREKAEQPAITAVEEDLPSAPKILRLKESSSNRRWSVVFIYNLNQIKNLM